MGNLGRSTSAVLVLSVDLHRRQRSKAEEVLRSEMGRGDGAVMANRRKPVRRSILGDEKRYVVMVARRARKMSLMSNISSEIDRGRSGTK